MPKPLPPATVEALSPPPSKFPYQFFEDVAKHAFLPRETTLNLRNAWWLMDAAFLSYSAPADIQAAFVKDIGATIEPFDGRASTQAYVASTEDWIVLAFRGTQVDEFWPSVVDWAIDARFFPVPDRHRNFVHAGFLDAIGEIWAGVSKLVASLQVSRRRPLWITGHSLGAALATVAANLCDDEPNHLGLTGLYTYGSPRVGDAGFGRRILGIPCPVWRFRNNSDLVTHVPLGLVFRHVGMLELVDGSGHFHPDISDQDRLLLELTTTRLSPGDAHTLSRLLKSSGAGTPLPGYLADHAPINYAFRIWNLYEASRR
jgi:triacylglycerol lipase